MIKSKVCLALGVSVLGLSQAAHAFDINAGDVTANVYGYAQLNAVYDVNEDIGSTTQAGQFSGLTDANNVAEGHFDADAQQSRIGISAQHKDGAKVVVEGDFRGGTFRLRHAYGSYEKWTVGKTWSNYNSWTGWTPTLDFDSTAGSPGVQDRVEQVRYTDGGMSFSLEKDYYPNLGNGATTKSSMPTFTARYEGSASDNVNFVVAGLGRMLASDDGTTDESAVGVGAFTGVNVNMGTVTLHAAINYSDGANAYLYRSGGNFGGTDAYLHNGDLETVSAYGGTIGLSTKVGDGDLNIVYGKVKMDLDDMNNDLGNVGGNNESNSNAFVNYMWYPVDNVMMGVEVGYFKSDYYNGGDADATRVMYSAQYSF
ncbi:DcaP family trimeric outer membrane transporter [Marinomonas gallaica]|uniref:DcaP family trimeric outer membrane transporter n=1 Tax=Marinomonas gallaica TaxID=1806667 RepID=UPI003CE4F2F3